MLLHDFPATEISQPVQRTDFQILPKWWIVERTFAWLNHIRRLSKDYEQSPRMSEALVYLSMLLSPQPQTVTVVEQDELYTFIETKKTKSM